MQCNAMQCSVNCHVSHCNAKYCNKVHQQHCDSIQWHTTQQGTINVITSHSRLWLSVYVGLPLCYVFFSMQGNNFPIYWQKTPTLVSFMWLCTSCLVYRQTGHIQPMLGLCRSTVCSQSIKAMLTNRLVFFGFSECGSTLTVRGSFNRQNLTSADVRFWRLKSIPAL